VTSQLAVNNIHWLVAVVTGATFTNEDMASQLWTTFVPAIKPLVTNGALLQSVLTQRVSPIPRTFPYTYPTATPVNGTGGLTPGPDQISGIITFMTAKAGRKYRGRMYVPFPDAAAFDPTAGGRPTGTYTTALQGLANMFASAHALTGQPGNTTTLQPVILHRPTLTYDPILTGRGNQKWAGQHRRGSYGKINAAPV
jgi:hypothetical protein